MLKTAIDTQEEAKKIVNDVVDKLVLEGSNTLNELGYEQHNIIFLVHDLVLKIIRLLHEQHPSEDVTLPMIREKLKTNIDTTSTVESLNNTVSQLLEELLSPEGSASIE